GREAHEPRAARRARVRGRRQAQPARCRRTRRRRRRGGLAMASSRRRRSAHAEEEHENDERWLLTYADMITLLMALFMVLFSISSVNISKFVSLQPSLQVDLSGTLLQGAFSGRLRPGGRALEESGGSTPSPQVAATPAASTPAATNEGADRKAAD